MTSVSSVDGRLCQKDQNQERESRPAQSQTTRAQCRQPRRRSRQPLAPNGRNLTPHARPRPPSLAWPRPKRPHRGTRASPVTPRHCHVRQGWGSTASHRTQESAARTQGACSICQQHAIIASSVFTCEKPLTARPLQKTRVKGTEFLSVV